MATRSRTTRKAATQTDVYSIYPRLADVLAVYDPERVVNCTDLPSQVRDATYRGTTGVDGITQATRGRDSGAKARRVYVFNGTSTAYNVAALGDALAAQDGFAALCVLRPTRAAPPFDLVFGGSAQTENQNLHAGYVDSSTFRLAYWNNDLDATITYGQNRMDIALVNQRSIATDDGARQIYFNSETATASDTPASYVTATDGFRIGNRNTSTASFFQGGILFLMFWNSGLQDDECAIAVRSATRFFGDA